MLTALLLSATLASQTAILPPAPEYRGASRALIVPAGDPWITPAETTQLKTTPRYDETVAYLRRLVAAAPQLKMVSIGKSGEGRDLWLVIASKEGASTAAALRKNGRPTLFAQAGIHSGEIDGKDAGLMLLRDMTVRGTKKELLDGANLLFVPIYSVDAHERFTRFTRINQRGPEQGGWRTTPRNLNLNRDYVKADAPETRAMIRALREWQPDLYADLHVTDGADYQYDVTFGWNTRAGWSPSVATWLDTSFRGAVDRGLAAAGHIPGELIFTNDPLVEGIGLGQSDPRLSNGYGDARQIPTVLVENHSLKPYDQRVLGMYVFMEHALRVLARDGAALRQAIATDRARRADPVPFSWRVPQGQNDTIEFRGIESRKTLSPVTGDVRVEWTGKPVTARAPFRVASEVVTSARRPKAYWIPAAWTDVIALLDLHGIQYTRADKATTVDVTMDRFSDIKYATPQFEGHVRVTATATPERRSETFPAGSVRVSTDQPLGTLAVLMLEPSSPDSLFQWGFFHSILNPTEYVEAYIMEPMAERMLAEDPKLAEEFRKKIADDAEFRGSSRARLQWLYQKTPFYDERARLYPVGRE